MKQRLQHFWPAVKFALRHMKISWQAFLCTDEVQALKRAFRLFWWRLGDVIALFFRLLWGWFINTRPILSVRDWWRRTKKAVNELPQYQFLCRFFRRLKADVWLRVAVFAVVMVLIALPYCVGTEENRQYTYLVITEQGVKPVEEYPDFTYEGERLRIREETGGDAQIILTEGQEVLLRHGATVMTVESWNETVENLLDRLGIIVGKDEMVGVNVTGLKTLIHIDDELRCRRKDRTTVEHTTREIPNYLLAHGETVVVQEGADGEIVDTYDDVYRDGKLVATELVGRSDSSAVTEIVEIGRKVKDVERTDTIAYEQPFGGNSTGGYLVFKSGYSMTYSDKHVCSATAYYSGGENGAAWTTATGHAVGVGIIAADPKVFPYHTRMFIQSTAGSRTYGVSQVEDCGGAVNGYTLDLWFPSYSDCVSWGRRNVYAWILD